MTPRIGSLCSGYGALDMAVTQVIGGTVAWHAEHDPDSKKPTHQQGASRVLAHRFPGVPNHGDISAIDWAAVEPVNVLTAGFPCTSISCAGKREGIGHGTKSGVWTHVADAIDVLRPELVFLENVDALVSTKAQRSADAVRADRDLELGTAGLGDGRPRPVLRAAGAVLGDLADLGYDARWVVVAASAVGACHRRRRIFIVAYPADAKGVRLRNEWTQSLRRMAPSAVGSGDGHRGELSLLPTPAARLANRWGSPNQDTAARRMGVEGRRNLEDAVALLPTPTAADGERASHVYPRGNETLTGALLPTPTARDRKGPNQRQDDTCLHGALLPTPRSTRGGSNSETLALLPTPRTTDGQGVGHHGTGGPDLRTEIALLPTPTAMHSARNATANRSAPKLTTHTDGWTLADVAYADRWGKYADAIARHAYALGQSAPDATEPGARDKARIRQCAHELGIDGWAAREAITRGLWGRRLSARFVEWMQMAPEGWVTDVPGVSRNDALRMLGNTVVIPQAVHAYRFLLTGEETAA